MIVRHVMLALVVQYRMSEENVADRDLIPFEFNATIL